MTAFKRRIVIVGGGVMGSATAYFLASRRGNDAEIIIVERDSTYAQASSALSASGMRQQFSTPANIDLSTFGAEFLRNASVALALGDEKPEVGFHEKGYLLIAGPAGADAMRQNHQIQMDRGARNILIEPEMLSKRFPWLSLDGISLACLGLAGEGWFDGYGLLQGFVRKAKALGCTYVAAKAVGFLEADGRIRAVELADGSQVSGDVFVLAAGCWSAPLAASVGIDLPVRPRLRNVFSFSCRSPIDNCPLVVDNSGVYFRPEGRDQFICGVSPDPDPDDMPLEVDYTQWDDVLWPTLASRVPAFESIKMTGAWAGYYEFNTLDHNGIIGPHGVFHNLIFATGFSGHGIMQSPGVGLSVAEIIEDGHASSIDVSALGWDRIEGRRPIIERNVI